MRKNQPRVPWSHIAWTRRGIIGWEVHLEAKQLKGLSFNQRKVATTSEPKFAPMVHNTQALLETNVHHKRGLVGRRAMSGGGRCHYTEPTLSFKMVQVAEPSEAWCHVLSKNIFLTLLELVVFVAWHLCCATTTPLSTALFRGNVGAPGIFIVYIPGMYLLAVSKNMAHPWQPCTLWEPHL